MAVYLWLPPAPRGRQCQLGSQSSPPPQASANGATGEADDPQLRPGCLRPGLFKSSNGSLTGFGEFWEM